MTDVGAPVPPDDAVPLDPVIAAALSARGASTEGDVVGLYYTDDGVPAVTPEFLDGRIFTHVVDDNDVGTAGWSGPTNDFDVVAAFANSWRTTSPDGVVQFRAERPGFRMSVPEGLVVPVGSVLVLTIDRDQVDYSVTTELPPLADELVDRLADDAAVGRSLDELVLEMFVATDERFHEARAPLSHHLRAARRAVRDGAIVPDIVNRVASVAALDVLEKLLEMTARVIEDRPVSGEEAARLLALPEIAGDYLDHTLGSGQDLLGAVRVVFDAAESAGLDASVVALCHARLTEAAGDLDTASSILAPHANLTRAAPALLRDAAWFASVQGRARRASDLLRRSGDAEIVDLDTLGPYLAPGRHAAARNERCPCGSGAKYKRCHAVTDGHPLIDRVPWVSDKLIGFARRPAQRPYLLATATRLLGVDDPSEDPMAVVAAAERDEVAWLALVTGDLISAFASQAAHLLPADEADFLGTAADWTAEAGTDVVDSVAWTAAVGDARIAVSPLFHLADDVDALLAALAEDPASADVGAMIGLRPDVE